MKLQILISFSLLTCFSAYASGPLMDVHEARSRFRNLPRGTVLEAARSAIPEECLKILSEFQINTPRRPNPWTLYAAQAACALDGGNKPAALAFAASGLALRGSDSDLLTLKALSSDDGSPAQIEALTEAMVFDRFSAFKRLEVLLSLGKTLNQAAQVNRSSRLLERWVINEPKARGLLVETYVAAGNRKKALDTSTKYLQETPADADLLRARARALLAATDRVLYKADFNDALELIQNITEPDATTEKLDLDKSLEAQALLKLNRPQEALEAIGSATSPELDALKDQANDEVMSGKNAKAPTSE